MLLCYIVVMSKIYIVATPIGNLEDITHRAVRILREVDVVLCEDTRVTGKLLKHYDISVRTMSYHAHSKDSKTDTIFKLLEEGKNLALVSDAGTPTISDPGSKLVSDIREQLPEVSIESVPGASAVTAALSIAGVAAPEFIFLGFLPHKKGRETLFKEIGGQERTTIFYESPHRILKALQSLTDFAPEKKITIVRELTKIHEEVVKGDASELLDFFTQNEEKVRGEFVVIVEGL